MARLEVSEFWILKAFFTALREGSFGKGSDFAAPVVDGVKVPITKKQALKVIRDNASELLPNIDKKTLENDNSLIDYLKIDSNRKNALGRLPDEQNSELIKAFEKPVISTETTIAPEAAGTMQSGTEATGGQSSMPSMGRLPSAPSITMPQRAYKIPQVPKPEKPEPGAKLVTANSSGVTREPYTPPSTIHIANKSGAVIREQPLKYSSGFGSSIKSGFSSFGRSAKKLTGGVLKSGVGILNSGNIPGRGAISGRIGRVRSAASNAGGSLKSAGKKRWLLMLFGLLFGGALIGGLVTSSNPTGQPISTAPITGNYGLDYTLPLKDPSIAPLDIKDQVKAAFPGAKLEYWENIIKRSVENSLNPALVLALWIEETGASQTTIKTNGGSEIPTPSGSVSLGHLGCAPWENQTIDESLDCLFKFGASYSNDQFPQFMAKYSGGPASDPFSNNPNFTTNIKLWYSRLVPSGAGAIQQLATTASGGGDTLSCPLPGNRTIGCGSFTSDPKYNRLACAGTDPIDRGHCGRVYDPTGKDCFKGTIEATKPQRWANAIDIDASAGETVYLPSINGQITQWSYMAGSTVSIPSGLGGGYGHGFIATVGSDKWTMYTVHMNQQIMPPPAGRSYHQSGDPITTVADTVYAHLHLNIGKNVVDQRIDPGWLPPESLGACTI